MSFFIFLLFVFVIFVFRILAVFQSVSYIWSLKRWNRKKYLMQLFLFVLFSLSLVLFVFEQENFFYFLIFIPLLIFYKELKSFIYGIFYFFFKDFSNQNIVNQKYVVISYNIFSVEIQSISLKTKIYWHHIKDFAHSKWNPKFIEIDVFTESTPLSYEFLRQISLTNPYLISQNDIQIISTEYQGKYITKIKIYIVNNNFQYYILNYIQKTLAKEKIEIEWKIHTPV